MSACINVKKVKNGEGAVLVVKKSSNCGLLNLRSSNMCWINSAIQMLEMTDLPLYLEGIMAVHVQNLNY